MPPTGALAHSPGMRLDQELNQQLFALQEDAQPTEPHWSRHIMLFFVFILFVPVFFPNIWLHIYK